MKNESIAPFAASPHRPLGTHDFPSGSDPAAAQDRACAIVTIYGARSTAEPMIARICRMHEMVAGTTASGEAYRANDSELLNWVHGTAAYGFLQAYHMYVQPLSSSERDRYYAEGVPAASL
jgi:uncharacterized protein (DUF2236 family)